MKTTTRLVAAAVIAAGALTLPPAAASAAPTVTKAESEAYWGAYATSTSGCTITGTGSGTSEPLVAGKPVTHAVTGASTITNGAGATTTISSTARGTTTYTTRGGRLSTADLVGTGRIEMVTGPTQTCGASTWNEVEDTFEFTLTEPQWLSMSATSSARTYAWASGDSNDAPYRSFGVFADTLGSSASGTWLLPPGSYEISLGTSWDHVNEPGKAPLGGNVVSGTGGAKVRLYEPGSAPASATGPGRAYASLGSQATCGSTSSTVPVTFTAQAHRIKSVAVVVNGKKVRTLRNVQRGAKVLAPISPYGANTVQVRLTVDPPGSRRTAVVTTGRSYRACGLR